MYNGFFDCDLNVLLQMPTVLSTSWIIDSPLSCSEHGHTLLACAAQWSCVILTKAAIFGSRHLYLLWFWLYNAVFNTVRPVAFYFYCPCIYWSTSTCKNRHTEIRIKCHVSCVSGSSKIASTTTSSTFHIQEHHNTREVISESVRCCYLGVRFGTSMVHWYLKKIPSVSPFP